MHATLFPYVLNNQFTHKTLYYAQKVIIHTDLPPVVSDGPFGSLLSV